MYETFSRSKMLRPRLENAPEMGMKEATLTVPWRNPGWICEDQSKYPSRERERRDSEWGDLDREETE
jgi:hypothetical protein